MTHQFNDTNYQISIKVMKNKSVKLSRILSC